MKHNQGRANLRYMMLSPFSHRLNSIFAYFRLISQDVLVWLRKMFFFVVNFFLLLFGDGNWRQAEA